MSGKSLTALRFQQSQIRIGDRVDLDHAGAWEPNRMRQLDLAAHARPVGAAEVSQVCIDPGFGADACAADEALVLHSPLDLPALVARRLRLAVCNRSRPWILLAGTDIRGPDRDVECGVPGSSQAHNCTEG